MSKKNPAALTSIRSAMALMGIAGMVALSACAPATAPEALQSSTAPNSATSSPSASASANTEPENSASMEASPDKSYSTGTYPIPMDGSTTSVGEPVRDAENRFVQGVTKRLGNFAPDAKVLEMGYETCGFYLHSETNKDLFDKIDDASKGNGSTKAQYSYISGAAAHTLCPEYANFSE